MISTKENMYHWATTGNFHSFLLMGNCYHKRNISLLEKLGENGVQQLLRAVFNSTDWLPKKKLIGYGTPRPPGEICLIQKIEYDFLYLFNRFKVTICPGLEKRSICSKVAVIF